MFETLLYQFEQDLVDFEIFLAKIKLVIEMKLEETKIS